jgi:hemin uptake protein HemP
MVEQADLLQETPRQPGNQPPPDPPVVRSSELFHGMREIWIEHEGVRYRLRITRRNKLILQK